MEYTEIKEWLDKLVANVKEANSLCEFNEQIFTCHQTRQVHLFTGIDIVADVMGLELKEVGRCDEQYRYKYFFMYKGIKFMQIEEERLASFVQVQ